MVNQKIRTLKNLSQSRNTVTQQVWVIRDLTELDLVRSQWEKTANTGRSLFYFSCYLNEFDKTNQETNSKRL